MSPRMSVSRLQEGLQTRRLGKKILFSRSVDSTNASARKLAEQGASEGTVVIAETQTAGHGRLGREWISPEGGLWFSIILKPHLKPPEASRLVFAACLAVAEALHELYHLHIETKWPNDVLIHGQKVCGILTETNVKDKRIHYIIIGIGINGNFDVNKVFPPELKGVATSLWNELGREVRLEELFRIVLERFENVYDTLMAKGFSSILESWKKLAGFLGHRVEVTGGVERLVGLAFDVDNDGSLVLKLDDGTLKRIYVGDVSLRT